MSSNPIGTRPVNAYIDEHGNIYVAENDLEQNIKEAEQKVGTRRSRDLLNNAKSVQVGGVPFRLVASNKEWQE